MKRYLNQIAQERAHELEEVQALLQRVAQSADFKEGQLAWLEKRTPRFVGN